MVKKIELDLLNHNNGKKVIGGVIDDYGLHDRQEV
jgi:hypothetical protein